MMRYRQCLCHNFPSTLAPWIPPSTAPWIHELRRGADLTFSATAPLCQHGVESPTLELSNASDVDFDKLANYCSDRDFCPPYNNAGTTSGNAIKC